MKKITYFCFIINLGLSLGQNSLVYQLTYTDFDETHYDKCVRLLNGSHQIGCQSTNAGNVGVLHIIDSQKTKEDFFNKGYLKSYVTLVDAIFFGKSIVQRFKASGKVQGVIVYEPDNFIVQPWSPELSCPGNRFGLYNSSSGSEYQNCNSGAYQWNPTGDGLTEEDIPFPVFYLKNSTDRDRLINCTNTHNQDDTYPLCAVQMKSRMFGAVDSQTCTRRSNWQTSLTAEGYCDPIGGRNIVSSLQKLSTSSTVGTILVTAPIDSRSFMSSFTSPGSDLATGFITLLATSKALGNLNSADKSSLTKNIIFTLLEGEAFDNLGTTRMLYDMKNGNFPLEKDEKNKNSLPFPIKIDNITNVVEFRQLGNLADKLYAHYDPVSYSKNPTEIDQMVQQLNSTKTSITVANQPSNIGLVPSSLQTILREREIPGVVLTDYGKNFKNQRYFSRYDTLKNLGIKYNDSTSDDEVLLQLQPLAKKLTDVATMAAGILYKLASGKTTVPTDVKVESNLTAQLLYCYLYKANCSLFQKVLPTNQVSAVKLPNSPLPRYTSVYQGANTLTLPSGFASYLLVYFTGVSQPHLNQTTCVANASDQTSRYFYLSGPVYNSTTRNNTCVMSSTFDTAAVSPALQQNKFDKDSASTAGLWTESRWSKNAFKLTMFLQQDETSQGMVLLAGCIMLVLGFTSVYFVNSKANVLFRSTPPL